MYENYYYEDERLYSTGFDDLDLLMEKAFCEGYEYAQREFAEDEERKSHSGLKAAGIGTGSLALAGGAIYGGDKLGKKLITDPKHTENIGRARTAERILTEEDYKNSDVYKKMRKTEKTSKVLRAPAEFIREIKGAGKEYKKANTAMKQAEEGLKYAKEAGTADPTVAQKQLDRAKLNLEKASKSLRKRNIALASVGGAAALGTGIGIAVHSRKNRRGE